MDNYALLLIFLIAVAIAAPLLYIYAKKGDDPRLRPKPGELTLACVLGLIACMGASAGLATLMGLGDEINDFREGKTGLQTIGHPSQSESERDAELEANRKLERAQKEAAEGKEKQ